MDISKVPFVFIDKALNITQQTPQHIYLILTKRAKNMKEYFCDYLPSTQMEWPLPNVYIGTTAENQQYLEERLPYLLQIPGERFLSIEPLLGEIDLLKQPLIFTNIHQIICGAETGTHARPCNLDWIRSIRDQCNEANIPFFLKQINAKRERILDDREHNELIWRSE